MRGRDDRDFPWSATSNVNCPEYHVSAWSRQPLVPKSIVDACYAHLRTPSAIIPDALLAEVVAAFTHQKNDPLSLATEYGTWLLNHDPRDQSADVEVAACCMGGEHVSTVGPWGVYPFTAAHAVYLAQIMARVCALKKLDPLARFDASAEPSVLQNGPIYVVSTHAERAIQTVDWPDGAASEAQSKKFGYGIGSGDPDLRWDIAVLDVRDAHRLSNYDNALAAAKESAQIMRAMTHAAMARGIREFWALDK